MSPRPTIGHEVVMNMRVQPTITILCFVGVDLIETAPSCHPLISLHSNVGQKQMESFLEELIKDREEESLSPHTKSNCIKIPEQ